MNAHPEAAVPAPQQANRLLFVYGTLLRGESNHHFLRKQCYLGDHSTEALFCLYDTGPYPAATDGGNTRIRGELYRVDRKCMARLDVLEDYPRLYTRRQIPSAAGVAWIYLWIAPVNPAWRLLDGDWRRRGANR